MAEYRWSLHRPLRRCVVNCPSESPPCPDCAEGETCSLISQSCESCAEAICVSDSSSEGGGGGSDDGGGGGPNAGAIAGGVVGGLALLAALGLTWWFFAWRRRRQQQEEEEEEEQEQHPYPHDQQMAGSNAAVSEKRNTAFTSNAPADRSRVGSMASTVLTRASNVIPIAYIPGVTNRSPPDSPGVVAPPVPSVQPPSPSNQSCHNHHEQQQDDQQHYFLPGDIRDSAWSQMTEEQRKSISPSLARSSVATTIYRDNAIVNPVPAQQAMRAKPAVVSVKSLPQSPDSATSPETQTPAVPSITEEQLGKAHAVGVQLENTNNIKSPGPAPNSPAPMTAAASSPIVARSGFARPVNVTKPRSGKPANEGKDQSAPTVEKAPSGSSKSKSHGTDGGDSSSQQQQQQQQETSSSSSSPPTGQNPHMSSTAPTVIEDSPAGKQSPFDDPNSPPPPHLQVKQPAASSSALPEAMYRKPSPVTVDANGNHQSSHQRHRSRQGGSRLSDPSRSQRPSDDGKYPKRSVSPFSDEHEVK